jgi:hypothetical protein
MAKSSSPSHAKTARQRSAGAAASEPELVIVSSSVEKDLVRRFDIAAKREARTRSSQIALLMRRWVEEQER